MSKSNKALTILGPRPEWKCVSDTWATLDAPLFMTPRDFISWSLNTHGDVADIVQKGRDYVDRSTGEKVLTQVVYCSTCGRPVEQKEGRGRRKLAHTECREMPSRLKQLEALLDEIEFGDDDYGLAHANAIRRRLWGMANKLNRTHKGRKTSKRSGVVVD